MQYRAQQRAQIKTGHMARLKTALARLPDISVAVVFGSLASGQEAIDIDVDIAVIRGQGFRQVGVLSIALQPGASNRPFQFG